MNDSGIIKNTEVVSLSNGQLPKAYRDPADFPFPVMGVEGAAGFHSDKKRRHTLGSYYQPSTVSAGKGIIGSLRVF